MVPFFDPWPYVNMCKSCKGSFSGIPKIRQVKSSNGINGMRGVSSWPGMTLTPVPAMYESAQLLLILSCYFSPWKKQVETESENCRFLPRFVSLNFQVPFKSVQWFRKIYSIPWKGPYITGNIFKDFANRAWTWFCFSFNKHLRDFFGSSPHIFDASSWSSR